MTVPLLSGKVFLLITGASQGIGRQLAQSFGRTVGRGSVILLLARNAEGLQETASKLPEGVVVKTASIDLSLATVDQLKDIVTESLVGSILTDFNQAVIIHNAGSVGDVTKLSNALNDVKIWREYYDLNVFSPAILNSVFMEIFNNDIKVPRLVINITSKCGIHPFKSMAYYCSAKAAREMFFKVFAEENPTVNVLNWSPGPVDTDMIHTIRLHTGDPDVKAEFEHMHKDNIILTTEQTVNRLFEVLKLQKYKSGDHVDYFDNLDN